MNASTVARGLASREDFNAALRSALAGRRGFAAGKLGNTERAVLEYGRLLASGRDGRGLEAFELALGHQLLRHAGVFPAERAFLRRWASHFASCVARLDVVGVFGGAEQQTLDLLQAHGGRGLPMRFEDQEPDRSLPADDARCWLPLLRGSRVLLVCPFAELLRARATRETFEAVWSRTGKRWFEPAAVEALELPYGFAAETRRRYATACDLLEDVAGRLDARAFDVALIAAGGFGIPLAAHVKGRGAVGISLGGHLQVIFGVVGARWRDDAYWRDIYFNEAWIDMPARYAPRPAETDEDYW